MPHYDYTTTFGLHHRQIDNQKINKNISSMIIISCVLNLIKLIKYRVYCSIKILPVTSKTCALVKS